jgi:hypothetical protein
VTVEAYQAEALALGIDRGALARGFKQETGDDYAPRQMSPYKAKHGVPLKAPPLNLDLTHLNPRQSRKCVRNGRRAVQVREERRAARAAMEAACL